jgi:hypothetical protein
MGSCNSVGRDVSFLGSALLGTAFPPPGVSSDGTISGGTLGAGTNAVLNRKHTCNKTAKSMVEATNTIVAHSIVRTIMACQVAPVSEQNVSVYCNPAFKTKGEVYESNSACELCIQQVLLDNQEHNRQEKDLWKHGKARVRQDNDTMYKLMIAKMEACGVNTCKACDLSNITQSGILSVTEICLDFLKDGVTFKSNLSNAIEDQLTNNQDVLSAAAQVFAKKGVRQISEQVSTSIIDRMTSDFKVALGQSVQNIQTIELVSNTSHKIKQVTEKSLITSISRMLSRTDIDLALNIKEQLKEMETIINDQNTLDSIGGAIFKSSVTIASVVDSTVGKVMLSLLAVLGVTLIIIISAIVYKISKDYRKKHAIKTKTQDLKDNNLSTFEKF